MFTLPRAPTSWLPYVGVKNIHASTEKAVSLGTKVQRRLHEIPNIGWITILVDPTGATICVALAEDVMCETKDGEDQAA